LKEYLQTYVQDLLQQQASQIYKLIKKENAHIYICGDSRMAYDVHETLKKIISSHEHTDEALAEQFMDLLKVSSMLNFFHLLK